jgi:hypothetical protein
MLFVHADWKTNMATLKGALSQFLFAARHEINRRHVQRGLYQGWTNFPKIYEPLQASTCQAGHKKQVLYLEGPQTLGATVQKIVTQSTMVPGICAPLACIVYHRFFPELDVFDLRYLGRYKDCTSNGYPFDYKRGWQSVQNGPEDRPLS